MFPLLRVPSYERFVASAQGTATARAIVSRFRATLHGADGIPAVGGALLVGNHTLFGIDSFILGALMALETRRSMSWLAERNLFRIPTIGLALRYVGAVPGTPDDAVRLLRAGHLVGVYPGGVDDSFKLASERYVLKWGERAGFARVAIAAGVPIVPIAATGVDDLFEVRSRETWLGRRLMGSARYDFPLPANLIPRNVPLDYHVLPSIETSGSVDHAAHVETVRTRTVEALESVLRPFRERRA